MRVARHDEDMQAVKEVARNIDIVCHCALLSAFEEEATMQLVVCITMPISCKMN